MRCSLAALALAGACTYDPSFEDCSIPCETSTDCPSGFSCDGERLCRPPGATGPTCLERACDSGPISVLANGSFDDAGLPWRQEPASPGLLCGSPTIMPDSAPLAACLGGGGDSSSNAVSRDLSLPAGAISAHLAGRICIATAESEAGDRDILSFDLLDGSTVIGALGRRTNLQGAATCGFSSFTLDAPLTRASATATLRIQARLDVGESTTFYVDSLVLTVACR